jgi:uridine kinase
VQFVVFLAISQLWPEAKAVMSCTVGNALYITVKNAPKFSTQALKEQLRFLIEEDAPLLRRRVSVDQAICQYDAQGKHDKAPLLRWRSETFFDEYTYGDYSDYFYGELLPSMGYLTTWDILPAEEGFFFIWEDAVELTKR